MISRPRHAASSACRGAATTAVSGQPAQSRRARTTGGAITSRRRGTSQADHRAGGEEDAGASQLQIARARGPHPFTLPRSPDGSETHHQKTAPGARSAVSTHDAGTDWIGSTFGSGSRGSAASRRRDRRLGRRAAVCYSSGAATHAAAIRVRQPRAIVCTPIGCGRICGELRAMDIAFAAPTTPAQGTWVVLAKDDGALGPTGSELDRRAGGALQPRLAEWGGKLKRGEAIELRYPAGLELDRLLVLSLGKPEETQPLRSGNARRQPRRQAEGAAGARGERRGRGRRALSRRPRRSWRSASRPVRACAPTASTSTAPTKDADEESNERGGAAHLASGRPGRGRSALAPRRRR